MSNYTNSWHFLTVVNTATITFDFKKTVTIGISLTGKNVIIYEFVTFCNCRQYWNNDIWFYKNGHDCHILDNEKMSYYTNLWHFIIVVNMQRITVICCHKILNNDIYFLSWKHLLWQIFKTMIDELSLIHFDFDLYASTIM